MKKVFRNQEQIKYPMNISKLYWKRNMVFLLLMIKPESKYRITIFPDSPENSSCIAKYLDKQDNQAKSTTVLQRLSLKNFSGKFDFTVYYREQIDPCSELCTHFPHTFSLSSF